MGVVVKFLEIMVKILNMGISVVVFIVRNYYDLL